jgi:hypothetical protein
VRTFSLFTTDTRYSVPTLTLVVADDEARAIVLANSASAQSAFHTAVEVREGGRAIYQEIKSPTIALHAAPRSGSTSP